MWFSLVGIPQDYAMTSNKPSPGEEGWPRKLMRYPLFLTLHLSVTLAFIGTVFSKDYFSRVLPDLT